MITHSENTLLEEQEKDNKKVGRNENNVKGL